MAVGVHGGGLMALLALVFVVSTGALLVLAFFG
jgi:hypothetical protein